MEQQKNSQAPKYTMPVSTPVSQHRWIDQEVTQAPRWCSVDLRDGNQALPNPMTPEQKLEYFQLLCRIGFKEIEVAFPSASQDDFNFTRRLTDEGHVPEDVFIMGLTQCRDHLIEKTFESLAGARQAIVHAYIATSQLHMQQVFNMTEEDTTQTAVAATELIRKRAEEHPETDFRYQFSPEEFTDTDPDFAVRICTKVFEAWGRATPEKPLILNLPATVERRPPHHYADLVEYFIDHFPYRDSVLISLHSHNDQGMAVAATEQALMAGADRVEGTLFGHGERTGNVDLVTIAGNLAYRGIETGLDFSDLPNIAATVERLTGLDVYYRQPYAGEYVFTAFSGSHQDAINKGIHKLDVAGERFGKSWNVPYLHVDPADLGRSFERMIRINSQSGKGGIAWVMEQEHGITIPRSMQPELRSCVQAFSDAVAREISSEELKDIFEKEFLTPEGPYELVGYWPRPDDEDPTFIHGEVKLRINGQEHKAVADGNGPISAFVHALRELTKIDFTVDDYHEQAIGHGAEAQALAFVPLKPAKGGVIFGAGTDSNIDQAAVRAIVAGLNRVPVSNS